MYKIVYTEHLLFRLKVRKIANKFPLEIYDKADRFYFDNFTKLNIAVKDIITGSSTKTYMVAFAEDGGTIRLVTIHPLKSGQELNRVYSGRWQKTKKTI